MASPTTEGRPVTVNEALTLQRRALDGVDQVWVIELAAAGQNGASKRRRWRSARCHRA